MDLKNVNTCDLVEELRNREGVDTVIAAPHEDTAVTVNGPATILIVID